MATRGRSASERRQAALERRARRAEVTDPDVVMEAAAAFLAVRPRSVAETRRRLDALGYPPSLADTVVERLVSMGYLDDRAFAQAWLESRDRSRPRGSLALRRELQLKGITRDVIEAVLSARQVAAAPGGHPGPGLGNSEADRLAARRLLERKVSSLGREPDPRRRRQKAYALLARHGFSPDVCQEVAASLAWSPAEGDDEGV